MGSDPGRVGVDERVVRDVNRIRNIAQEAAQPLGRARAHCPAGPKEDDAGEDENDAERIVEPILPQLRGAADAGHGQHRHHR